MNWKKLETKAFKKCVIACSGGMDSIVLLDLLRQVKGLETFVCYVDHRQREDTNEDIEVIQKITDRHKLKLICVKLDVKKGASENTLRNLRLLALEKIMKKEKADAVITAHHADDNIETFLFRLIRGTHPLSIKGIYPIHNNEELKIKLIRPLLPFFKGELLEYAKKENLDWHEDLTNRDFRYARNEIRHRLIPLLEELRPGAKKRALEFFLELEKEFSQKKIVPTQALILGKQVPTKEVGFNEVREAVVSLLGAKNAPRTTNAHWNALRKILEERRKTKTGGGMQKTLEFPGGGALIFKGSSFYWNFKEKKQLD